MKINPLVLPLSFALTAAVFALEPKATRNLFSTLQPEEHLAIRFTSFGCFHSLAYDFKFTRDNTGTYARISKLDPSWNDKTKSREFRTQEVLGTLKLTSREIDGLDRLIRFYRSNTRGGCTTVDEVRLTLFRGTESIATENHRDASCTTHRRSDLTTLLSLTNRLALPKQNERTKRP